jgi:hypothetical protein
MKRNPDRILSLPKTLVKDDSFLINTEDKKVIPYNDKCLKLLEKCGLSLGTEGEFYCGEGGAGQLHEDSIIEYNRPPSTQPGLWCQWVPTKDDKGLEWDGNEKFYAYTEWLTYIVENFLKPWGYVLNGTVKWQGEDSSDKGRLVVENNVVKAYTEQEWKEYTDLQKVKDIEAPLLIGAMKTEVGRKALEAKLKGEQTNG